jgi:hypothetical protein
MTIPHVTIYRNSYSNLYVLVNGSRCSRRQTSTLRCLRWYSMPWCYMPIPSDRLRPKFELSSNYASSDILHQILFTAAPLIPLPLFLVSEKEVYLWLYVGTVSLGAVRDVTRAGAVSQDRYTVQSGVAVCFWAGDVPRDSGLTMLLSRPED